jgi:hypothetical protein
MDCSDIGVVIIGCITIICITALLIASYTYSHKRK